MIRRQSFDLSDESEDELISYDFDYTIQDEVNSISVNRSEKTVEHINLKNIIRSQNECYECINEISKFMGKFKNLDNVETAIAYNLQLQKNLKGIHQKIVDMLVNCKLLYEQNESFIKSKNVHNKTIIHGVTKGIRCGAPFFKNRQYHFSTPNNDYLNRKYNLGEFFMFDKENNEVPPHWSLIDKIKFIHAVKEQAIRYLENKSAVEKKLKKKYVYINPSKITCKEILKVVDKNFKIDFEAISLFDLSYRHTICQCQAMWNLYLKPSINRGKWTEEENILLFNTAQKYNCSNWKAISNNIKNRSEYQCFIQYQTVVEPKYCIQSKRGKWSKEEDKYLLELVKHYSRGSATAWNTICSSFENRTRHQIICRYQNSLHPDIQKGNFSKTEDVLIMAAVEEYGEHFNQMPGKMIRGRSTIQLRNRYSNSLKEDSKKECWTLDDDKTLIEWVDSHGTKKWGEFAKFIKHHTRIASRTRYQTIVKYFCENPDGKIEDIPRRKRGSNSKITKKDWRSQAIELIQKNCFGCPTNDIKDQSIESPEEDPFMNRLRDQETDFFNLFKYSHNFDFDNEYKHINCNKNNIKFIWTIMNLSANIRNINHLQPQIPHSLFVDLIVEGQSQQKCKTILHRTLKKINLIPYNLSSILGIRSLSFLLEERKSNKLKKVKPKTKKKNVNFIKYKEKFSKRLYQLFYQSALLTFCEIENSTSNNAIKQEQDIDLNFEIDMRTIWSSQKCKKRKSTVVIQNSPAKLIKL